MIGLSFIMMYVIRHQIIPTIKQYILHRNIILPNPKVESLFPHPPSTTIQLQNYPTSTNLSYEDLESSSPSMLDDKVKKLYKKIPFKSTPSNLKTSKKDNPNFIALC